MSLHSPLQALIRARANIEREMIVKEHNFSKASEAYIDRYEKGYIAAHKRALELIDFEIEILRGKQNESSGDASE